jgi:hypothetical protein
MPFEIGFCRSSKTGRPKAMLEGVIRAVARAGATMDLKTQVVTLSNGEEIHLGIEPQPRQMMITAEAMSVELSRFAYALADETATIILSDGLSEATPSAGEPPMHLVGQIKIGRVDSESELTSKLWKAFNSDKSSDDEETEREAAFERALARRRAEIAAEEAPPAKPSSITHRSSLFQRLSDALFGKAI